MSKVLTNEGMLGKILERLQSPTCLVRAALTSRSCLSNASSQATIHGFRSRQSPKLLGIYVTSECMISQPEFVLLPDASSPELEAAFRHGNFSFHGMDKLFMRVWDCRNDRVLFGFGASFFSSLVPAVKMPLGCPGKETVVFPPPPPPPRSWPESPHAMLLPDKDDDDASCYNINIFNSGNLVCAKVFALRDGSWTSHCSALVNLSRPPLAIPSITVLMRGKIYMVAMAGYVLVLDLSANRFSTFDLPQGVEFDNPDRSNLALSRGDDSVLYLVHLNGDKLTVWLHRMPDSGGAGGWSRRDTIALREACDHLQDLVWEFEGEQGVLLMVVGVGDNAEFVFLEFTETGVIVCIHAESSKAKVVYKRDPINDMDIRVYPFMTVWSPVFPALGAAPAV